LTCKILWVFLILSASLSQKSEPAPTSAPSTGCLLWLGCQWTPTKLIEISIKSCD
jgi:hypothetical protein